MSTHWFRVHALAASGNVCEIQKLGDDEIWKLATEETALEIAVKYGQSNVVDYLIDKYPSMAEHQSSDGSTILHAAVNWKRIAMV